MLDLLSCGSSDTNETHELLPHISKNKNICPEITQIDPTNTELHLACLTEHETQQQNTILSVLKSRPKDTLTTNSSWELPLHYACLNKNISFTTFQSIYDSNPDAVYSHTFHRCLPIHYYCRIGAPNIQILRLLIAAYPESIYEQAECLVLFDSLSESNYSNFIRSSCRRLSTSLSLGAASILSLRMTKIKSDPATFWNSSMWRIFYQKKVQEDYEVGWSPLHLAVVSCSDVECTRLLIDGATLQTSLGRRALDCARIMIKCRKEVKNHSLMNEFDQVNMENIINVLKSA